MKPGLSLSSGAERGEVGQEAAGGQLSPPEGEKGRRCPHPTPNQAKPRKTRRAREHEQEHEDPEEHGAQAQKVTQIRALPRKQAMPHLEAGAGEARAQLPRTETRGQLQEVVRSPGKGQDAAGTRGACGDRTTSAALK